MIALFTRTLKGEYIMASQKLSTYNIRLRGNLSWNNIIDTVLSSNSKQSYCIINEQGEAYIGGCYIFESIHNQTIYNISENKFETITVPKQNIIKFDIFINNNALFLWGNKKAAALFITILEQASHNTLIIEYNQTDFKTMLKHLLSDNAISFSKMKITDIIIDNGIVANCSVNLSSCENAIELVQKYIESIAQITVSFGKEAQPVSITLYSSGSVVVFKDRDDIDDEVINSINAMIGGVI